MKQQDEAMSCLPSLTISTVLRIDSSSHSIHLPVIIKDRNIVTKALIDTGAGGAFIDEDFAIRKGIELKKLIVPIPVYNVDKTLNKKGMITRYTWLDLEVGGIKIPTRLYASGLGGETIILGLPWLQRVDPTIRIRSGTFEIDPKKIEEPNYHVTNKKTIRKVIEIIEEKNEPTIKTRNPFLPQPKTMEPEKDELVIGYIKGENILGIFTPQETPSAHDETQEAINRGPSIGQIKPWKESMKFSSTQNTWINAKLNPAMVLAQEQSKDQKPKNLDALIPSQYHRFKDVFEKKAAERFPISRPYDHAIELKPGFVPRNCKVYPLTPKEEEAMTEFVDENLRKGYIRKSTSPMASPFFFVGKKDGALRPCQDYRYLNEGTVKNAYPLPLISELVDKLKGAQYFSKLDLRSGYNNIRIKDGDQWKAAFKCARGLFEPTVMFFGLCNSPATFQAFMNDLFKDMIEEGWLIIYMDDMLIFSKDLETHQKRTERILQRLRTHDLFLKPEKCVFETQEVEFLGLIVKPNQLEMDPGKLKGIRDWPAPTTVKGVRAFLGFGNFYRKFISKFSDLARPLNDLTRKDVTWNWTTECQTAFDDLKNRFITAPVLIMPDKTKQFQIESDASKFATGAVLRQQDVNGDWHPCSYLSQSFNEAQRNYDIYDRELLGIVRALEAWRHYLEGGPYPVQILSDHKNLTYFRIAQKLNRRQARWSSLLSMFDIELHHIAGTKMIQSDVLSRLIHLNQEISDNEAQILLPDRLFIHTIDISLKDKITSLTQNDQMIHHILKQLTAEGTLKTADITSWTTKDNMIFYKDRCYVPADQELRREVVKKYHDTRPAGHPGQYQTLVLLRRDYWWPGMAQFVKKYVEGCALCQQNKINTHPTVPPMNPIKAQSKLPFQVVTTDFITDLPLSNGYDSCWIVVDHNATKGIVILPCSKEIDAEGTAKLYHKGPYRRFGLPEVMISDRGPQFASKVMQELTKLLGIKSKLSTAYHPQTDGQTERMNQEVEAYLRIFCAAHPEEWTDFIPDMEFSHNQRIPQGRNESPFYLMMGYNPRAIPTVTVKSDIPSVEQRMKLLINARDEAAAAHELARQRMAARVNHNFKPFILGQKVWLEATNIRMPGSNKKTMAKREGPFPIKEVLGPLTYKLQLPQQWKIHPVFHASLLTPFRQNDVHGPSFTNPPPNLIEEEEEYVVEAIVGHKKIRGKFKYLVKWKGYSSSENSWEPEEHLKNAPQILRQYQRSRKL